MIAISLAILGQRLPVPSPLIVDLPDSAFKSVRLISDQDSEVITGEYRNTRFYISDVRKLTFKNVKLIDCDVRIAFAPGHTADNVYIRGGAWNVYPSKVERGWMQHNPAWYSATNFTWIGGDHKATFGGNGLQSITFPKDQLKNGSDPVPYSVAKWKLRDSAGKTFNAAFWTWTDNGSTITVQVSPRGNMASGPGYWSCIEYTGMTKGLRYSGFNVAGMEQMSFYFVDGMTFKDSEMAWAYLDATLDFEYCANITLDNVTAYGNRTVQGNGADVSFLYGIRGLTVKDSEIGTLAITSADWEVSKVNVQQSISWIDNGWVGEVVESGIVKRDALGVVK